MLRMEYVTMIPTEVFDCFAQGDYIPLMAQAAMEHALSPRVVDQLFEETADRQYTRDLLFSSVVGLMSLVVCRIRPSINAAYQKNAVPINVSLPSALRKDRAHRAGRRGRARCSPDGRASVSGHHHHERRTTPLLPGYRIKILDGNHLPGPSIASKSCGPWGPPLCRGTPWSYSTPS